MSDDNSGSTIELNRRRVLGALGVVGAASAGAGAGTFALFSDTETSSGNSVQAGTLDLTLGNGGSATLTASDVAPGDSSTSMVKVNNVGTIDGSLDVNVSNVTSVDADPEPEQALDDIREFTINYGYDNADPQNQVSLQSEFGDVATVEIDLSSSPIVITADLPYSLSASGQFDDSITFAIDADNDGVEDFQLAARDYDDDDSLETVYDDGSALPSGSRNRNQSVPSGYDVRLENGNKRFVVEVPGSDISNPSAITGQANLAGYNPSTSGSNLAIPLIPGFGYNNPPVAGTSAYDGTATKMVEMKNNELRTLADLLDVTVTISSDGSLSDDDTFVASGKVNRLPMVDAEPNKSLPAGETSYVIVEYELSPNVGNAVQKDTVNFDIEVDLNQKDSQ